MKLSHKILAAFVACVISFAATKASIAESALFLSPTRVTLDDENKVGVINVTNMSKVIKAYTISLENLIMTPEGITSQVDNFEYSAKRMLRFVPREFVLQPGERQSIRIMARTRPDTEDGAYHSHIHFLEDVAKSNELNKDRIPSNTEKGKIEVQFAYSALVPVILNHGRLTSSIGMKDHQLFWKDKAQKHLSLAMQLTRSGNAQGTAYIDTVHIADDGTHTPLSPRKTVQIYRELAARKFSYDVALPEGVTAGAVKISLYDSADTKSKPLDNVTLPLPD